MQLSTKILLLLSLFLTYSCNKDDNESEIVVCFEHQPQFIKVGDEVIFKNCSKNALTYLWDFGDNTFSSEFEPIHTYYTGGVYIVSLTVENKTLTKELSQALVVTDTCKIDMSTYDISFGIDYSNPENYTSPGDMSNLSDTYFNEIRSQIGSPTFDISGIKLIYNWFYNSFTFQNAGGNMIGQKTIDQLYESKVFYGCHSASLILSSILREFGFPAIMIETADIQWAYDYSNGTAQFFKGHVMSEIYVEDKWILLDINGKYVDTYDPLDPFIRMTDGSALFVYTKGIDIWDYGVFNELDTHNLMIDFSNNLICYSFMFSSNNYQWKNL